MSTNRTVSGNSMKIYSDDLGPTMPNSKVTLSQSKEQLKHTTNSSKLRALKIPEYINVLNHTVHIKEIPNLPEVGKYGDWDADRCEIRLFTEGVADSVILHTYYHELVHCLLEYSGYPDLSADEVLTDHLGGLLAQALASTR